jgi:anti-sigma factor RsiW
VRVRDLEALECREVVELVTEFLGGAMVPEDRARLEQHLLVCPPCTAHVAQMKSTVEHLARLAAVDAAPAVSPALVDMFRNWKKRFSG